MVEKDLINVFVSHYHEDADRIVNVINLIEKKDLIKVRDSSIYEQKEPNNAENPEYIKSLIRPQIDWAGTVIVLIGKETKNSEWVDYEINYAGKNDKKIIGVFLPGSDDSDIPESFKEHGSALCSYRSESLNNALNDLTNFETSNGSDRNQPIGLDIVRYNC